MSILDEIVATKHTEVAPLRRRWQELRAAAESGPAPRDFAAALQRDDVALISEVKRRSPSAGAIRADVDVEEVGRAYEESGAAAVSVLTDGQYFGGSLADLERVRSAVSLPVLRKDFVVDPVQLWEARAAEADAVLLIVRVLDDALLADLVALAAELGVAALVEVHDGRDLDRAMRAGEGRIVVGVNNRDLATFRTELRVSLELAAEVPPESVLVAESGIRTAEDVERLGEAGVDAILVGESLMRARDIAEAAAELVGVPRRARGR